MTILIVDDDEPNRLVLRDQLELLGHQIVEATDGVEALAWLECHTVDVVISDILMPRMDGYRLCSEIRRSARLSHLPLIVYTSTYISREDEKLAHRSGADRYLLKPAPMAVLAQTLDEVRSAPRAALVAEDPTVMREYNAVLIKKLEEKSAELEVRNAELAAVNAQLEESRARADGIIASAMDAIVTVDEAGCILLFNTAAEVMFGAPAAAMMGRPLDLLLPGGGSAGSRLPLLRWDRPGTTSEELRALGVTAGRRADGREFPIEASLSRVEVAGRRLYTVIFRDVTQRQRAEQEVRLVSEQMRALALRLENIREQERTQIAREIHDVLAQELTRLKLDLVWLARRAHHPIDEPTRAAIALRIKDAVAQADVAITTVQRIATELRPVILDSLGLPAAVEWQAEDFSRRTGIACHSTTPGGDFYLDRDRSTALFRILQESLTNIARHAQASQIEVELAERDGQVALTVRDNGRGIAAARLADPLSIGLIGMRERALAFGGTAEIVAGATGGTTVSVRLPLESPGPDAPSS